MPSLTILGVRYIPLPKNLTHQRAAVCKALELELIEPEGWICCGSSAAHRVDPDLALTMPMENLAVIEKSGFNEVTMPCAACFNRHKAAQYEIHAHPDKKSAIDRQIDYEYQDLVEVTTLVESIMNHVGVEKVANKVRAPLAGLRVVCYYGCLLTRPPEVTGSDHPENPTDMDELMASLGAEVLDWSYKTNCCGAAHASARTDIVVELSGNLIKQAQYVGADLIVVACPLCHMNLDGRQFQMDLEQPLPVLYFTQLMAIALGLPPEAAMLKKNFNRPPTGIRTKRVLELKKAGRAPFFYSGWFCKEQCNEIGHQWKRWGGKNYLVSAALSGIWREGL